MCHHPFPFVISKEAARAAFVKRGAEAGSEQLEHGFMKLQGIQSSRHRPLSDFITGPGLGEKFIPII